MKQLRTRRGVRLVEGGAVLSEVLRRPGPTHSVFDVLAAAVSVLAPGPRIVVLGFAGGGVVAPLRALGFTDRIDAVDRVAGGERIFRRLSASWCGAVRFVRGDAVRWLAGVRRGYDVILEDLSVRDARGTTVKPTPSIEALPRLARKRLNRDGVLIANLLPSDHATWIGMLEAVRAPFREARVVHMREFENRIVVAGTDLPSARSVGDSLRDRLRLLRSRMSRQIAVRDLPRGECW